MVKNKMGEKSIAIQVPTDLHKHAKVKATLLDMTLKDYIILLMSRDLDWVPEDENGEE